MKNTLLAVVAAATIFTACSKDDSPSSGGNSKMSVYLTDGPASYDAVLIDIQEVQVNTTADSSSGWQPLTLVRPGVYNLLQFRNGLDTLLGSQMLPAGTITQVRLILGTNNSVVVKGVSYPLQTPSAQQSGLKLNIHATLQANIEYKLWLDFDAGRSIVQTGNGKYILKPVIRAFTQAETGSIKGIVLPPAGVNAIYALQNGDTVAAALPDTLTGTFQVNGLSAGSYTLSINSGAGLKDTTLTGVQVTAGQITTVATVQLHP